MQKKNLPDFEYDINGHFISFDGNRNLRPAGCQLPLTKEHIEEYIKCANDIIYFAENYYYIVTLDEGKQKIKLYDFQKDLLKKFVENRFNIVVASRQVGKTTTYAIYCLWTILFNSDQTIGILANKESTAIEILGRVRLAYEMLPKWLQQGVKQFSKKYIEVENGSRILSFATSSSAARAYSMNIVILDEFAFLPTNLYKDFKKSVFPVISSSKKSKIIIVSTYNGINHFYKMYKEAEERKNNFIPTKIIWKEVPTRDEKWKEDIIKAIGKDAFMEEFECIPRTVSSDRLLIPSEKIIQLTWKDTLIVNNVNLSKIYNYNGTFRLYEYVKEDHIYSIGVDTSRMTENDDNTDAISVIVLDITKYPFEVVALYYVNEYFNYRNLPKIINILGKYYNEAFVFIENNDIGAEVANLLIQEYEYPNVYFEKSDKPGFRTTKKTKRIGVNNLKSLLLEDNIILNDYDLIQELAYFEKQLNGTFKAAPGHKDDIVMSLIAALFFLQDDNLKFLPNNNSSINIINNLEQNNNEEPFIGVFGELLDEREEMFKDYFIAAKDF